VQSGSFDNTYLDDTLRIARARVTIPGLSGAMSKLLGTADEPVVVPGLSFTTYVMVRDDAADFGDFGLLDTSSNNTKVYAEPSNSRLKAIEKIARER